jgi:hypothetical protein
MDFDNEGQGGGEDDDDNDVDSEIDPEGPQRIEVSSAEEA